MTTTDRRVRTPCEETVHRIRQLCELGARTPMLEALFPSLPMSILGQYRQQIVGSKSTKGPGPCGITWFSVGAVRRLESSFVARVYLEHEAAGMHSIDAMIEAFKRYLAITRAKPPEEGFMTLERAWLLVKLLRGGAFVLLKCPHCGGQYLHDRNELVNHKQLCPIHRTYNLALQPHSQQSSKSPSRAGGVPLKHTDLAIIPPSLSKINKAAAIVTFSATSSVGKPLITPPLNTEAQNGKNPN